MHLKGDNHKGHEGTQRKKCKSPKTSSGETTRQIAVARTRLSGGYACAERLLADLSSLAAIGGLPDGGVDRLAWSDHDLAGRRWFAERMREAGIGVGVIFGNYLAAAIRNPSAAQGQFGNLIFGFALTEALGIFSLLIALLLLFVF